MQFRVFQRKKISGIWPYYEGLGQYEPNGRCLTVTSPYAVKRVGREVQTVEALKNTQEYRTEPSNSDEAELCPRDEFQGCWVDEPILDP